MATVCAAVQCRLCCLPEASSSGVRRSSSELAKSAGELRLSGSRGSSRDRRGRRLGVRAEVGTENEVSPGSGVPSVLDSSNPDLSEKFAVVDTGRWECRSCGYVYDQYKGDSEYPIPPGVAFTELPQDWRCPTCGAAQTLFQSRAKEVAGFAQNQKYGLGGNSLTSGQKSILIYGSLLFFFFLFISGYWLS